MENNRPLISIITVVYNGVETIEQTIQSVINQIYKNTEYIIVDGGSNDGTVEIIKKYETRITKWISEPDDGIYDAINKGIKLSKGAIVGIVNSDDWLDENALSVVVQTSNVHQNVGVYHGLLAYWNKGVNVMIGGTDAAYLSSKMIEHPTCFVRKEVYEKVGLFNCAYLAAADYDFMLRAKECGIKFLLIPVVLSNFRIGGVTSSFASALETLKVKKKHNCINNRSFLLTMLYLNTKRLFRFLQ